ncbi:MAG TPA: MarR family winged helix-turn-helix transcriptional regulator [Chloroflexota bacterium]|nr:MarR family winged helix-turn-helix transcriptional regulator [Chloroflexota bacterium]
MDNASGCVFASEPGFEHVHAVIQQLVRFFVATDALNRSAKPPGLSLTPQQLQAAMQLMLRGELTIGELAAALGITPGWASRLADDLVVSGHAVREHDAADRRIVRLRIAPAMRERCAEVYGGRAAAVARALADASPTEIETLVRLMGRIASEFEALAAPQPQPAAAAPAPASVACPLSPTAPSLASAAQG